MDTSTKTFSLPILEYCFPVRGSAAEVHCPLLYRHVYSVARLCHDQSFLSSCHFRHVAALCGVVNSTSKHYLFSELPSATARVRQTDLRHQLIHWSSKYQGVERLNLQGVSSSSRLVRGNNHPYTVLDPRMLDGISSQSQVASPGYVLQFSFVQVLVRLR